ncbi:MAG: hypothetical protein ACFWUD_02315 [Thermocaproicibacter melissae]|jgi:hypothetical protein|uniref:hypothetical protein n=1 Tax=Thermocaproicibacter melissae TaxID=2966552 RepID=UPI0024B28558|nr:hypothetical protein [Thermocaproicibacter melissae]WBY63676.1 hypothetical protein NOG13_06820 [Thermocaproicibacter melissae]
MTPEKRRSARIRLIVLGVLSLLLGVNQIVIYCYANAHIKEILREGSSKMLGIFPVRISASYANPNLTVAVVALILSAVCFFTVHRKLKK